MGSKTKTVVAAAGSLALLAAVAAAAGFPGFDSGVSVRPLLDEAKAAAGTGEVWISVGQDDLGRLSAAEAPMLGRPVSTSSRASVFRVLEDDLARVATLMHDKFHKCGGFFAHATREEAEADLSAPAPSPAGFAYSVDQGAVVRPLAAAAREDSLRATIDGLASYHNRYYQSDSGTQAAQWLAGRWRDLAMGMPGATVRTHAHGGWKQPSVVLTIPGAELPDEIVVLGGHLDSIGGMWGGGTAKAPGADDNASGIAVLTEAVRILGEAGFRPKRTIQFMGYAAEEVGLRGSADIARQYKTGGQKVVGVVQFDMTNFAGSGSGIWVLTDNVDPALSAHLRALATAYSGVPVNSTACGYGCSDHASWTRSGFPASAAFESAFDTMNRNIHTDRDTVANSGGDAAHSVPFARLAVAFAVETAKPASPARVTASR
ncbi:MAG: M20/M25/M40 family metallo-hydrolase [Elusimicrobiota bacterium]|nr:M20/M25/M40 family metallo-hydrolase [Elusimicrobiota bacterium]